jgi:hypothetical protein
VSVFACALACCASGKAPLFSFSLATGRARPPDSAVCYFDPKPPLCFFVSFCFSVCLFVASVAARVRLVVMLLVRL